VESLAGIMGGDATAVSDDTRNVYVEAAFWWPEAVAGRRAASTSAPTPATASSAVSTRR
jgi:phenylalanyl-tRNA synthetase beta subunit